MLPRGNAPGSGWAALIGFVGLCQLVGLTAASLMPAALRQWYPSLHAPPFTPPPWVFAPAWTLLYLLIGIAGWLVWRRHSAAAAAALRRWGWQLGLNALWTPAFFGLHNPALGLAVMAALLVAILITIRAFAPISRAAAGLMLPYLAWVCFAAYLNAGLWWLNR
ncbi:MAG: tryptophan-rich sensory protein [Rhodospirillales bacterium]|nr:tryptophan-rich sensory protein [Rhodospirillales bacterium]